MSSNDHSLPVAIIGAGPVGLAAAAHLFRRHQPFVLFESGSTAATNVLSWKHVRVFSPWRYNIDQAIREILQESSPWETPDDDALPTGHQLYDQYLKPFSELPAIRRHIKFRTKVISIGRKNLDKVKSNGRDELPFVIQAQVENNIEQFEAKAIIDASGTWHASNPVGSGGVYAVGEVENSAHIFYGIPDIAGEQSLRYQNKNILVVGSGHSSVNTILELEKLKEQYPDTTIHWVLRKKDIADVYGGQENDALAARGGLGTKIEQLVEADRVNVYTPFQIHHIQREGSSLSIVGFQHAEKFVLRGIDEIICNTGSRPDFSFTREVRIKIDPALESVASISELIDPNIHSCGTVRPHGELELRHPEKDFYIVGSKSYGRAPTFLMATGYEQVRSIAAFIDGDLAASRKVELNLPETGVCNTGPNNVGCCGEPSVTTATGCCS
jgi:thioredoxin reductase